MNRKKREKTKRNLILAGLVLAFLAVIGSYYDYQKTQSEARDLTVLNPAAPVEHQVRIPKKIYGASLLRIEKTPEVQVVKAALTTLTFYSRFPDDLLKSYTDLEVFAEEVVEIIKDLPKAPATEASSQDYAKVAIFEDRQSIYSRRAKAFYLDLHYRDLAELYSPVYAFLEESETKTIIPLYPNPNGQRFASYNWAGLPGFYADKQPKLTIYIVTIVVDEGWVGGGLKVIRFAIDLSEKMPTQKTIRPDIGYAWTFVWQ